MIKGFKHKNLQKFYETGNGKGLNGDHIDKIRRILARMNAANIIKDMDAPGLKLHPLKGNRKGEWAVSVNGNWRIVFKFDGKDFHEIDFVDYH